MMLALPQSFIQNIQNTFQGEGQRWLESFPDLLEEAARRWGLTDIQPVSNLSYNFVAFAGLDMESNVSRRWLQSQETLHSARVVLKLGIPSRELTSEIAALRFYNGRGACRFLDVDTEKGMLLLERLQPGHMLSTLEEDDAAATRIAAEVMSNLWKGSSDFAKHPVKVNRYKTTTPAPAGGAGEVITTDFIQLKDWFDGFKRLRQRFNGGTGPMPVKLVETAESLSQQLLVENKDKALLHGDFHHFNVLESERGWLAIDPKGVLGPKGYEVGPLLINPVPDFLNESNPKAKTEKRIAILSEMLDMERERIRSWSFCHAVLSAWWSIEDNDPSWGEYSLRCAEIFGQIRV
jgi:streptomycin 6-kinase